MTPVTIYPYRRSARLARATAGMTQIAVHSVVKKSRRKVSMIAECSPCRPEGPS